MNPNMILNFPPIDHSAFPPTQSLEELGQPSDFKYASLIYQQNLNPRCRLQWVRSLLDIPLEYSGLIPGDTLDLFDGLDTGSIHPLFRREAIIDDLMPDILYVDDWGTPVDSSVYNNLLPALGLATAWLHVNMGFFWNILRGTVHMREGDEKTNLYPRTTLLSEAEQQDFETEMDKLAQLTRIGARDSETVHGETSAYVARWLPAGDNVVFRFSVNSQWWTELASPDFQDRPLVEKCSIWVVIASTLMHEFSHCIWMYRFRQDLLDDWCLDHKFPGPPNEPHLPYYKDSELGIAWEVQMLSGTLWVRKQEEIIDEDNRTWDLKFDGKYLPEIVSYTDNRRKLIQRISATSLIRFMRKSTWTANQPVTIYVLHLQRIVLPAFSPMLHDSKHSTVAVTNNNDATDNMQTSDDVDVNDESSPPCSSHDDGEEESDPGWDPTNPTIFQDQHDADMADANISPPPSHTSSRISSLYNITRSEALYKRRRRQEEAPTIIVGESDRDRDDNTDTIDATPNMPSFAYPDPIHRSQHTTNYYDPVLTMPEDNELLRLEPPVPSEDAMNIAMQGLVAPSRLLRVNNRVVDNPGAERGNVAAPPATPELFSEEDLRAFDARFPATSGDNTVSRWLFGVRTPSPQIQTVDVDADVGNTENESDAVSDVISDDDHGDDDDDDDDDEYEDDVVMQVVRDVVMGGTDDS